MIINVHIHQSSCARLPVKPHHPIESRVFSFLIDFYNFQQIQE